MKKTYTKKEVEKMIDFGDTYPIWMQLKNNENGEIDNVPSVLYPVLDSFWESMKVALKIELNTSQNKPKRN